MTYSAESMTSDSSASILLKGPFGFGKTIAACSMAVEGPIWLAYWDKKKPLELLDFYRRHRPELLKYINIDVYGSQNAHEYLNKLIDFQRNGCKYVGIITDSVTFMTTGAVNWSMGFRDPKGGKTDKVNSKAPQMIPDFDEYKVETSLVTQALDICRTLPVHNIWTAHPLPSLKMEGTGSSMKVSTVKNIVSYGQKVGAMVPGGFTEVYHMAMSTDYSQAKPIIRRIVTTQAIGEDFAKTSLGLPVELDITDKLFWEVWKKALKEVKYDVLVDKDNPIGIESPAKEWTPKF